MPRYDSLRKIERDRQVRDLKRKHPDWSQKEIGVKFGIGPSNVSRILAAGRRKKADGGTK